MVDASIVLVLVSGDERRTAAHRAMRAWLAEGETLHAPSLMPYEVASGLTRLVQAGAMPAGRVADLWTHINALPITYHALSGGGEIVDLALQLRRHSAYDAAYLSLAGKLGAELWTFDGPLAANAAALGLTVLTPS